MPIEIKDYFWKETPEVVIVRVPLKGVHSKKVDFFHSDQYVKLSFPPYICELFLPHKIKVDYDFSGDDYGEDLALKAVDIKCIFQDASACLEMKKDVAGKTWGLVTISNSIGKDLQAELRSAAVAWRHQFEKEQSRRRLAAGRKFERQAISDSIQEDQKRREDLQRLKDESKRAFFDSKEKPKETKEVMIQSGRGFNSILAAKVARQNERMRDLPPPRGTETTGIIETDFTKIPNRYSNHLASPPLREYQENKEAEWRKIEDERKLKLSSEKSVDELMAKAEHFFKVEDFASAIEVFTHGINNVCGNHAAFFNNRGAVHLKTGNYYEALSDCSKALELLNPPCQANAVQRAKAHVRRGACLASLELYEKALAEYQEAGKILPDDEKIHQDCNRLDKMIKEKDDDV